MLDVIVIGAGPAGCSAAIALSGARVMVLEARDRPAPSIGEHLPAASQRLLAELGVDTPTERGSHLSCFARTSRWGSSTLEVQDSLRDLDGAGLLLDRGAFDAGLRDVARASGAIIATGARVTAVEASETGWVVRHRGGTAEHRARVVIDASGREGRAARPVVDERVRGPADRLTCAWVVMQRGVSDEATSRTTYVESAPYGWWYTAPIPRGGRVVALHTDPDLAVAMDLRSTLIRRARTVSGMSALLDHDRAVAASPVRFRPAGSGRPAVDDRGGRLAAGDATMTFDPIAGQGLFHALYTGLDAGRRALRLLSSGECPPDEVSGGLDEVWRLHRSRLDAVYAAESRWSDQPFWSRRRGAKSRA